MSDRTTDEPLVNPESDLLGLAPHAERLADLVRQVPTPFTIGVYGEWGAGKTTFAYFVEHYLAEISKREPSAPPVEFIRFEAWPYKTADELWRALIIRIAAQLYRRPKQPVKQVTPPRRTNWSDWLVADAVVLREAEQPVTDESEYQALLARLDRTLYGGIGKSAAARWRLDQEEVLVTTVKAGLSALGAVSPIVAGIRAMLNLDGGGAPAAQREKNEATRARIESIDEFRKVLADLLEHRGKDAKNRERRLCIFLDDLDRCTPDVALDLLDAIKVFLAEARFVFVLAADEEIIGRGLRLRYRDLAQADAGTGSQADLLAREGQQYFEKIVQLRIHIPEASPEAAHRFIAAQFPEWMPATDIVYAALGSNPRRVKQYCNWMMFRHSVDRLQTPAPELPTPSRAGPESEDDRVALLNKLIALSALSPSCLRSIAELAADPKYATTMQDLERHVGALGEDPDDVRLRAEVADSALQTVCKQICDSAPLFRLIVERRRFSEFARLSVETLASIADMRPRTESILEASDRVFMRILQLTKTASVNTRALVVEDFGKLRTIEGIAPHLMATLQTLAQAAGTSWTARMAQVEAAVQENKEDPTHTPEMKAVVHAIVTAIQKQTPDVRAKTDLRGLILTAPRLSDMLREVVLAYCAVHDLLSDSMQLLDARVQEQSSDERRILRLASHGLELVRKGDAARLADIEERIELRKWAAAHCLWMRSFAKLNALDRCWPDLAKKLRRDFGALRAFENEVASRGTIEAQYQPLWDTYKGHDHLRSFLALQPLFGSIDPAQLQKYLVLSQVVAPAGGAAAPATGGDQITEPPVDYHTIRVRFERTSRKNANLKKYQVEWQVEGETPITAETQINWKEVDSQHELLRKVSLQIPQVSGQARQFSSAVSMSSFLKELASTGDYSSVLRELGAATFNSVFPGEIGDKVDKLNRDLRYRIIVEGPSEITGLPIETMYSRNTRSFLALSHRTSLVRWGSSTQERTRLPLTVPLRILSVLANPSDTPPLNLEGEEDVLRRAVEPAVAAKRVTTMTLGRGQATWLGLRDTVKSFRPHILHFVGHGVFDSQTPGAGKLGSIILETDAGKTFFLPAPQLAELLGDEQIQIAVLNGCDTGTAARNEAISSLAEGLTNAGVPAVIATMREVMDDSAMLFSREFYRALCAGEHVEGALAEARKALSVERRDWSVYALFASMVNLDVLRIPSAPQRGGDGLPPGPQ